MTRSLRSGFGSALLLFAVCLLLVGCSGGGDNPKVTKENYEKIKNEMTEKEVKDILGEPSDVNTPPNLPNTKGLTWKSGNNMINIMFKDGKIEMKTSQFVK